MVEPVVGKKYKNTLVKSEAIAKILYIGEGRIFLSWTNGIENLWTKEAFSKSMEEYVPPPKKIKKTGWTNLYFKSDRVRKYCLDVHDSKEEAFRLRWKSDYYITTIEVTWEEEVPGDEDAI